MAHPAIDTLQQAIRLLAEVAAEPALALTDEDLCALTSTAEEAGRLIDSTRLAAAAEIDDRSQFDLGSAGLSYRLGHRRGVHLVEQLTRTSQSEAARRIRVGSALRPRLGLGGELLSAEFPIAAAAVARGSIGLDAAAVVTRCLAQAVGNGADLVDVEAAERELVAEAERVPADGVAIMARAWREALDPDGSLPREEKLRQQRSFVLHKEREGLVPFHGVASPMEAAELKAAFAESMGGDVVPRFLSPEDLERGTQTVINDEGEAETVIRDVRTREQRQFDIVMGLIRAGKRSRGQRGTATVLAVVTLDDLESGRGIGWLDGIDEPVSASTINELVCDSGFRRVTQGPKGEILSLGETERCFSYQQRWALAARDGGCVWPQCTAPPSQCHAHHVVEWSNGGATDVDNGVLLCAAHHHMLHGSEFAMRMIDGLPHLRAPLWLDPAQEWVRVGKQRLSRRRSALAA